MSTSIKLPKKGSKFKKADLILDEEIYWKIIDQSVKKTSNQEDQEEYLVSKIEKLTPIEIIGFSLRTDQLLEDSYTSLLWCAAHIMNHGCSDELFEYFRCWIISRGKEAYYQSKANPDYLINELDDELDEYEFESFWYLSNDAFENKTGEDLDEFLEFDITIEDINKDEEITLDLTWDEDDRESMKTACPKLYEKFMGT